MINTANPRSKIITVIYLIESVQGWMKSSETTYKDQLQ